jgi:hypothetical protein
LTFIQSSLLGSFLGLKTWPRCRANGAKDASPGERPRESSPGIIVRPARAEGILAPLQGAQRLGDFATQGVALGLHPAALSAPEDIDFIG